MFNYVCLNTTYINTTYTYMHMYTNKWCTVNALKLAHPLIEFGQLERRAVVSAAVEQILLSEGHFCQGSRDIPASEHTVRAVRAVQMTSRGHVVHVSVQTHVDLLGFDSVEVS